MRIGSRVMLKRQIERKALGAGVVVTLEPRTQGVIEDIRLTRDCKVRWDGNGLRTLAPVDALRDLGEYDDTVHAEALNLAPEWFVDNPFQPRSEYDKAGLFELAESMIQHGFVGRLLGRPVVPTGEAVGRVELAYGHRRIRAARIAKLETVPVELRFLSDRDMAELGLLENLQREDLTIEEEAAAYAQLRDRFGLSIRDLAHRTGSSKSRVERLLLLTDAAPAVMRGIAQGVLSQTTAEAVARDVPVAEQATVVLAMNQVGGNEKQRADRIQQAREIQAWLDRGHPPIEKIEHPMMRNWFRAIHYVWAQSGNRYARALQIAEQVRGKQPEHWSLHDAERVLRAMRPDLGTVAKEAGWTCDSCRLRWLRDTGAYIPYPYGCNRSLQWCIGYVPNGEDGVMWSAGWKDTAESLGIDEHEVITVGDAQLIIEHLPVVRQEQQRRARARRVNKARTLVADFRAAVGRKTWVGAYCARTCHTCELDCGDRCKAAEEGQDFSFAFQAYRRTGDGKLAARCKHHEMRPEHIPALPSSAGRLAPEVADWLHEAASSLAEVVWIENELRLKGRTMHPNRHLLSPSLTQEEWEKIDSHVWMRGEGDD